jgi:hypothetical protein
MMHCSNSYMSVLSLLLDTKGWFIVAWSRMEKDSTRFNTPFTTAWNVNLEFPFKSFQERL